MSNEHGKYGKSYHPPEEPDDNADTIPPPKKSEIVPIENVESLQQRVREAIDSVGSSTARAPETKESPNPIKPLKDLAVRCIETNDTVTFYQTFREEREAERLRALQRKPLFLPTLAARLQGRFFKSGDETWLILRCDLEDLNAAVPSLRVKKIAPEHGKATTKPLIEILAGLKV